MGPFRRRAARIYGRCVPGQRLTRWAAAYFVLFVCLPVLGFGFILDLGLYYWFRHGFGTCYAILCLFD